jgi:hypothetical protein
MNEYNNDTDTDILDLVIENEKKRAQMIQSGRHFTNPPLQEPEQIYSQHADPNNSSIDSRETTPYHLSENFTSTPTPSYTEPREKPTSFADPLDPIPFQMKRKPFMNQTSSSKSSSFFKKEPHYEKDSPSTLETLEEQILSNLNSINYENWLSIELHNAFHTLFSQKNWQDLMNKAMKEIEERLFLYLKNELMSKEKNISEAVINSVIENYKTGLMSKIHEVTNEALHQPNLSSSNEQEEKVRSAIKEYQDKQNIYKADDKDFKPPLSPQEDLSIAKIQENNMFKQNEENLDSSLNTKDHHSPSSLFKDDLLADSPLEKELSSLDSQIQTSKTPSALFSSSPTSNYSSGQEFKPSIDDKNPEKFLRTEKEQIFYKKKFYQRLFISSLISIIFFFLTLSILSPVLFFAMPSLTLIGVVVFVAILNFMKEEGWFYSHGLYNSITHQKALFRWKHYIFYSFFFNFLFGYLFLTNFQVRRFESEYSSSHIFALLGQFNTHIKKIIMSYMNLSSFSQLQTIILYFFLIVIAILYVIHFLRRRYSKV